jgi:hypothetical protein
MESLSSFIVIPAKAGIHGRWIPAFAGMTEETVPFERNQL